MTDDFLVHYGTPRHSGRYPWGSGKDPYQSASSFLSERDRLRKEGMSDTDIARAWGMTTTEFRAQGSIARAEKKAGDIARAVRLKDAGLPNTAIAEKMGLNESSVRDLLKPDAGHRQDAIKRTSDILEAECKAKRYIEYGTGVEMNLQTSTATLNTAVESLRQKGYNTHEVYVKQPGRDDFTILKVLVPPGVTRAELMANRDKIRTPGVAVDENGISTGIKPPTKVSSKRLRIRYAEDGGTDMDGVIQLRRGVQDISLGSSAYAQVRINVDGTHYLKGMAMYTDKLPKGVDMIFNTNKPKGTPALGPKDHSVLKPLKDDPENPFGTVVQQRYYKDKKTGKRKLSALNIVNEEGSWDRWSATLASQFLSKQSPVLAKKQLKATREAKEREFKEIMSLTNPVIRKKLLKSFAEDCDSAAVHLKAKALPGQASQVILPMPHLKKNHVYAPNFRDGTVVSLVRYPHGGTFEIPQLVVNNKDKKARRIMGRARDAIGIHPSVAERLSGADFDGDSVTAIPHIGTTRVRSTPPLKGLKGFEPKRVYPAYPGMKRMRDTQAQMGKISNLITDMTLKGASGSELARAVRHSMVVIDAEKHYLNYKQSERDNGIAALRKKYQGENGHGAATLISRAKGPVFIEERKLRKAAKGGPIDPKTGKLVYEKTGRGFYNRKGKWIPKVTKARRMTLVDDAHILSSGTHMEGIYADHANALKALANRSRKAAVSIPPLKRDPRMARKYAPEVSSLRAALNRAIKQKPLERQAEIIAQGVVSKKVAANPDMSKKERAKIEYMTVETARARLGTDRKGTRIRPTPREWEAIQRGAVSNAMLEEIVANADSDHIKKLAMPRETSRVSTAQQSRIMTLRSRGATQAEIAEALGLSVSQVKSVIYNDE
jgi:DNA-binding CsgD family transcriptional regulator